MAFENYELCNFYSTNNYRKLLKELNKKKDIKSAYIKKENNYIIIETIDKPIGIENLNIIIRKFDKNGYSKEVENKEVYRGVVYLEGLDCANCGAKIEQLAEKMLEHERIMVDFSTTRFMIETTDKSIIDNLVKRVEVIAHVVDPNIIVKEKKMRTDVIIQKEKKDYLTLVLFISGFVFFGLALLFELGIENIIVSTILYILAFLSFGQRVIRRFLNNIYHKRFFDENFLMTIAGIGAICTGHYIEASMVMVLYQLGEFLQNRAVNKSRLAITELLSMKVKTATLKLGAEITEVDVETILPGDIILVQPNQMIPLDGVIVSGQTYLDKKSLTGEAKPVGARVGTEVLSGSINLSEPIEIKVSKPYSESMINKILELVEDASENKAKAEHFISRFARIYTPIIVVLALIFGLIVPTIINIVEGFATPWDIYSTWLFKSMVLLVISCPCSVVISIPLAFFTGIGLSSKNGILIKGSNYLEELAKIENVVFDKTGTLTKGVFQVQEIVPVDGVSENDLIQTMAYGEFYSKHPIGQCIVNKFGKDNVFPDLIQNFETIEGLGIKALVNGSEVVIGNKKLVDKMFPDTELVMKNGITIYCFKDNKYIGYLIVADILKEEAAEAIKLLRKQDIKRIIMLTGDHQTAGYYTANQLNIDDVYTDLLPDGKVDIVKDIKSKTNGRVLYVGDGINDAPVIATSDVGVAMGSVGADATIEVADVVIMSDNLTKVSQMIRIARKTRNKVIENIVISLLFKFVVFVLDLIPSVAVPLSLAVFSDVGVCLLTILNTMRLHIQTKKHIEDCDCLECVNHKGEVHHD